MITLSKTHLYSFLEITYPNFKSQKKQDKMLGVCLMFAMTNDMLKQISRFDISCDMWIKFENFYSSKS